MQEYIDSLPPNLNDMWSRFKEQKEQSVTESSLNSTRLNALSGLLQNPTHYTVNTYARDKQEEIERKKKEDIENMERMKEEQIKEKERLKKLAAERSQRRQELKNRRGCSEEESNGSYSEIIMEEERKRERMKRDAKKEEKRERRNRSPTKKSPKSAKKDGGVKKGTGVELKEQGIVTNIKSRKVSSKHSDSMDTLFSIPEDASFEQSPSKAESEMKSRQRRHRHIIDPLMKKLRDKIKLQRDKIDKERRKELQRVEKLKKLEMLLNAKRKGKLSDKAIDVELDNFSSTSALSATESSHVSDSTLNGLSSGESTVSSLSTTLKDSTVDSVIKLQVKKYPEDEFINKQGKYIDTDSTAESSDFNNIIVERLVPTKGGKKNREKKDKKSKSKQYREDEFGENGKKGKKDKKKRDVFGVQLTDKDIVNQLQRYENYMTPDRRRLVRDAGTMYPSPITVSPPSKRRSRDVLMKSAAIQTSPSVRTTSPSYAYDEVPVSPVPYMSDKDKTGKRSRQRTPQSSHPISPALNRSRKTTPTRKTSRSPVLGRKSNRSRPSERKMSSSPITRPTSGSPGRRRFSPPITRRQAQSPIWKPESEMEPPKNRMFIPETDENVPPKTDKPGKKFTILNCLTVAEMCKQSFIFFNM